MADAPKGSNSPSTQDGQPNRPQIAVNQSQRDAADAERRGNAALGSLHRPSGLVPPNKDGRGQGF